MNHIKHGYLHVGRVLEVVRRVLSLGSLVSPVPVPARPSAAFWKVNNAISPSTYLIEKSRFQLR